MALGDKALSWIHVMSWHDGDDMGVTSNDAIADLEALQARCYQLEVSAEIKKYTIEDIERIQAENKEQHDRLISQQRNMVEVSEVLDELRTENATLREALVRMGGTHPYSTTANFVQWLQRAAREALDKVRKPMKLGNGISTVGMWEDGKEPKP